MHSHFPHRSRGFRGTKIWQIHSDSTKDNENSNAHRQNCIVGCAQCFKIKSKMLEAVFRRSELGYNEETSDSNCFPAVAAA